MNVLREVDVAWRGSCTFFRLGRLWLTLLLVCLLTACSDDVTLFDGLSQAQANEMYASLLNQGITVRKNIGKEGVALSVPAGQTALALGVLKQAGLPREAFEGLGTVFGNEGLVMSPLTERARYLHALSQELSRTLTLMDGVVTARVHVVLAERAGMNTVATPASASVFIKHLASQPLNIYLPRIRDLVAHGAPGLKPETVSVALFPVSPLVVSVDVLEHAAGRTSTRFQWLTALALSVGGILGIALVGLGIWRYRTGRLPWEPSKSAESHVSHAHTRDASLVEERAA